MVVGLRGLATLNDGLRYSPACMETCENHRSMVIKTKRIQPCHQKLAALKVVEDTFGGKQFNLNSI